MPVCPPCGRLADAEIGIAARNPGYTPAGHRPEDCRDHGRAGCPCQHRPAGTATPREDPHA